MYRRYMNIYIYLLCIYLYVILIFIYVYIDYIVKLENKISPSHLQIEIFRASAPASLNGWRPMLPWFPWGPMGSHGPSLRSLRYLRDLQAVFSTWLFLSGPLRKQLFLSWKLLKACTNLHHPIINGLSHAVSSSQIHKMEVASNVTTRI